MDRSQIIQQRSASFDPTQVTQRAYSILTKAAVERRENGAAILRGTATTPTPDRYGDVVEPLGAIYQLPLPMLWQHMSSKPVGSVFTAARTEEGIDFAAELPQPAKSSVLIERFNEAVESVELGLVRGVSIGFRALPDGWEWLDPNAFTIKFTKWEWLELSLVTIPANAEATIEAVKHYASAGSTATARSVTRLSADDLRRHHTKQQATYLK